MLLLTKFMFQLRWIKFIIVSTQLANMVHLAKGMKIRLLAYVFGSMTSAGSYRQLNNKFSTSGNIVLNTDNTIMVGDNRTDYGKPQSHSRFFC